ncbi:MULTISPECIES: gas vesicle protein GvpO [Bacillaceae]|uniref:Gas vesicle protein n=2 Tax=Metabacillus TaxID=2675233 RepID=A0ABS5LHQ8_9BACI|nr:MULTISPECIES: gas vesicle protein GvpO [Bacillaceae]AZB44159.1 gas vesicle protein GvpR [Bacillus sp. FJAT-42376]KZZ83445.1 gas vesicle protein GvpR [Bacillus sp. SJS]MBS2970247.1 gas vesicle protein [Metabacillus flavus]
MKIKEVMKSLNEFFSEHIAPPHKITSIEPTEEGCKAVVEVVEEREYMRKYAKDEMLGVYDVTLDAEYDVTSYTRKSLRPRSAMMDEQE